MPRRTASLSAPPHPLAGIVERYIKDNFKSIREAARTWGMNDSTLGKVINTPSRIPEPETMRLLAANMGMSLRHIYSLVGMSDPPEVEETDRQLIEAAIAGFSKDGLVMLSQMTPAQKAQLTAWARAFLGEK